jgi:hypothetical protein
MHKLCIECEQRLINCPRHNLCETCDEQAGWDCYAKQTVIKLPVSKLAEKVACLWGTSYFELRRLAEARKENSYE